MSIGEEAVGELVVTFTAAEPNRIKSLEKVVVYASSPTLSFEGWGHWLAYLCRMPTAQEAIDYWKRRALVAEAEVYGLTRTEEVTQ